MARKWMSEAFGKNKGKLHKALHVPEGERIPEGKLEGASHSKNSELRHEAQAAKNAHPFSKKGGKHSHKGKKKTRRGGRR